MSPDGTITFKVRVKNTGKRDGAETVQLYVHENRCSVDRPYKELKGFRKIFLKAGESRDVSITIDRSALSFWDENSNGWKAEKGDFEVLVGDASDYLPLKLSFKLI
jgi:beta-glucosidase